MVNPNSNDLHVVHFVLMGCILNYSEITLLTGLTTECAHNTDTPWNVVLVLRSRIFFAKDPMMLTS